MALSKRAYYSAHHIITAAFFARQAKVIEDDNAGTTDFLIDHWSYVVGSVLSSVAYLEATVNELFADVAARQLRRLKGLDHSTMELMADMWRHSIPRTAHFPILDKYAIALSLARKPPMSIGSPPLQPVKLLIELRNYLTHYEPEWVAVSATTGSEPDAKKLGKRLRGHFPPNPLTSAGRPFFPDKVLGHGCAAWAVKSSTAFVDEFARRLRIMPSHEHLREKLATE